MGLVLWASQHDDVDVNLESRRGFWRHLGSWPDRLRSVPVFVVVFVPLALLYIGTANPATQNHIDPLTNALTGWHLGMTGSVVMPEHDAATAENQHGNVAWILDSPKGPVSQYPPGAAVLSAPVYRIFNDSMDDWYVQGLNRPDAKAIPFPLPSGAPAAIAASLATAAAMGLLATTIPFAGGSRSVAVIAGYVGGLATTMWSTASEALWQHGPASLWLALGIYLAARSQLWGVGLAFGAAVITRPPTALIAAAVGLTIAWVRRSPLPAAKVGLGSLLGLGGLLWYNHWLWGELTVTGGYGSGFTEQLTSADSVSYVENIASALFDPSHGLLVYSPFLVMLIPGLRAGWRKLPDWGRGAAIGALVYFLVHLKANRASGGGGFLGYRYPLEALTSAGVLLTLSYVNWVAQRPLARRLFWGGIGIAILLQINWKFVFVPIEGRSPG